jgi:hypothetical protein
MEAHRPLIGLAIAIVPVVVGLCLFDDDHVTGADPGCSLALPATVVLLASIPLLPAGRCVPAPVSTYRFAPGDRPAPPPRA